MAQQTFHKVIIKKSFFKPLLFFYSLFLFTTFATAASEPTTKVTPQEPPIAAAKTVDKEVSNKDDKKDSKGHFVVSLAAVYSTNLAGIHNEQDYGRIYPLALLLEMGANDNIGFETGLIFVERQYQVENAEYSLQQDIRRVHIPVSVKLWWHDFVAISLGTYISFAASGIDTYKIIRVGDNGSLRTPAEDFVEFGFESALTLNVPVADKTGFFVEARYFAPYYSVEFKKINSIYALAGIKYDW